jgi:universal stress protein A
MPIYTKILAVVDLTDSSTQVAGRAQQLAIASPGAAVTLLHVVEFVPVEPLSDSLLPTMQIETELLERARARLSAMATSLATSLGTPAPAWEVVSGNVKTEIVRHAREGGFDLIVIGSHERHGLSILVNLTEDTVLHAAPCDVLGVRLSTST